MGTTTAPKTIGDVLLHEVLPQWSRDPAVLASGKSYQVGHVLALANNKYQELDPAGVGSAATAAAVCLDAVDATAADKKAAVVARGAVVEASALVWPAGITAPQQATATSQLAAAGIIVRTGQ